MKKKSKIGFIFALQNIQITEKKVNFKIIFYTSFQACGNNYI